MSYQNKRQTKNKILLDILKDIDLNKISNKEAAFLIKKNSNHRGIGSYWNKSIIFYKLTKEKNFNKN